ncbi:L-piperidine-6-carboxylate dehydrogenase [Parapedobacter tibetensis]|uniref:L-piperidine-6-carboxylate dehydrogenase n=1 Tax=Parapedobacter tibetensis TaxID=2972951 RepID=UPI00214D98E0|nr:aldehyde dehydrogenase family protein [Parapedobacter tibetensis]
MNDINIAAVLKRLSIKPKNLAWSTGIINGVSNEEEGIDSISPVDGKLIAAVGQVSPEDYANVVAQATKAFMQWRDTPSPQRGEIVRQFGEELRKHKQDLGTLVSYEMGKSLQEGLGEVQEMIDICDFATGLSRQLYGLTMQSERQGHRMYEQWHPLGVVGIISAFNFPVAVWSWNAAIAWVCGNVCVWKPSEKTPITAVACQAIIVGVLAKNGMPEGISCLVQGGRSLGERLAGDHQVALISATGSTRMGKSVAVAVASRLGKSILELGGNNAIIITQHADLDVALLAAVFGAVGTAGQRCTSTRRLIVHEAIYERFKEQLVNAYSQLRIGNPLDENNHVGPLIDHDAVANYMEAIARCKSEGGHFIVEGEVLGGEGYDSGCYVQPCIAEVMPEFQVVKTETFAPILYIMKYETLDKAIRIQNNVPQGLSSAIMTLNIREAEHFLSASGSDCGIANVNIGTSGAEIGGAFGGEKETGGGRESGSDAWKAYMRRQTNTINYSDKLPLAQGITFGL